MGRKGGEWRGWRGGGRVASWLLGDGRLWHPQMKQEPILKCSHENPWRKSPRSGIMCRCGLLALHFLHCLKFWWFISSRHRHVLQHYILSTDHRRRPLNTAFYWLVRTNQRLFSISLHKFSDNQYAFMQLKNLYCVSNDFSYNSKKHCRIFIIFDRNITEKVSNQKTPK